MGNTDHRRVVSNLRLRLKAQKSDQRPPKLHLNNLANSDMRQVYAVSISNRFDCLGQISKSEEAWQLLKNGVLPSIESTIGRLKPRKKSWISQETLDVIELRRKARLAKDMVIYKRLNGVRDGILHRDRKLFTEKKATDLEEAARMGDTCNLYKHLRDLTDGNPSSLGPVTSNSGNILTDKRAQLSAWKDHFSSLLSLDCVSQPDPDLQVASSTPEAPCGSVQHPFTFTEILKFLKRMKNNRAPGVCGIPAELLKYGGEATLFWLQVLFSIVFRTEWIPKDWRAGIILPLWKRKGSCRICSNYRGITFLSVPGKLFVMTLLDR